MVKAFHFVGMDRQKTLRNLVVGTEQELKVETLRSCFLKGRMRLTLSSLVLDLDLQRNSESKTADLCFCSHSQEGSGTQGFCNFFIQISIHRLMITH